jgi:hypothetical protein
VTYQRSKAQHDHGLPDDLSTLTDAELMDLSVKVGQAGWAARKAWAMAERKNDGSRFAHLRVCEYGLQFYTAWLAGYDLDEECIRRCNTRADDAEEDI